MQNLFIVIALLSFSCSSFHIVNFPDEQRADVDQRLTLQMNYCRNTVSNNELHPPLFEAWEEDYLSLPNNGFISVDDWLIFATYNGYLAAVDIGNGELIEKINVGDACAVPPTVYKNIVYQTCESGPYGLIAYNITEGRLLWRVNKHLSRSSPVIVNEKTLFQTLDGEIFCFNYLTGEEIWQKSLDTEIRNSPAFIGDKMITVTLEGRILAFEYTSGVILWERELDEPVFADPVIEGKRIYIISHRGRLSVLNINDGEIVHQSDLHIQSYIGPTIDEKHIFVCLSNGRLIALDKITFEVIWSFNGDGPISGSALVTDSYIYFTSLGQKFYILSKNDGHLLQTINLPGRARSTPLINRGKLILGCEEKQVIAYVEKQ